MSYTIFEGTRSRLIAILCGSVGTAWTWLEEFPRLGPAPAIVGALSAVIVSGIADATWLIARLLVIFIAFVVNLYGLFDQSRWFMDLARHFTAYRAMGFDVYDLESAAVVVVACATGAGLLLRCGLRAVRFRPRVALFVDA